MSKGALDRYEKILRGLLTEAGSTRVDLEAERAADPFDDLQRKGELDIATRTLDASYARQREIRAALERLADGEYGFCEDCGEAINARRLEAAPWATLCVPCKEEEEALAQAA